MCETKYKCPNCQRILTADDCDALGFEVMGCPDCGVEYTEMEEIKNGE